MKTINFAEYTYILNIFRGDVEISEEDYKQLENKKITMHDIMDKYELNYDGYNEECYGALKFDDIVWEEN